MISVLLAEDEILELRALEHDIDYASVGMQVVGTARDGMTALELLKELKPDVLISDIVMPKQSGLQLLRTAKELNPDIFVVIISGHQSFEYAQKAIEYGVESFLTKPFFPEQINEVLTNISFKIQQRNRRRFEDELFVQEWAKNLPLLRENFVRSLIQGAQHNKIEQHFLNYNILLEDAPLSAMCILPEERNDLTKLSLRKCVSAFFEEQNRACAYSFLVPEYSGVLCVLFQCSEDDSADTLYDLAEHLRVTVLTECGFSSSVGTGSIGTGLADISTCADQALQALDYRYYLGAEKVVAFQDIATGEQAGSSQQLRQLFPDIILSMNQGDAFALEENCDKLFRVAMRSVLPHWYLQIMFAELLSRVLSARYESQLDSCKQEDFLTLYERIMSTETLYDMMEILKEELIRARNSVSTYIKGRKEWLVNNIKEIINKHYFENLTIDEIAKQAFISTGYATRLFRQYTGESINSYLVHTRMESQQSF